MAVLPTLRPNVGPTTITSGTWLNDAGGTVAVSDGSWARIDDDPQSPTDTDWIEVLSGGIEYALSNTPADFGTLTSLEVTVRARTNGLTNDTYNVSVQIFDNSGNPISDPVTLASGITTTTFTNYTGSITGLLQTTSKVIWDGAIIRINVLRNAIMGADSGCTGRVSSVEVNGTYNAAAAGTEYTDSGTVTLKLTPTTKREIYTAGNTALRGSYLFDANHGLMGGLIGTLTRPYTLGVWAKSLDRELTRTLASLGEPPPELGQGATIHVSLNDGSGNGSIEAYEENSPATASDTNIDLITDWYSALAVFRSTTNREIWANAVSLGSPNTDEVILPDPTHLFVGQFPDASWMGRAYIAYVFLWYWELNQSQIDRWHGGEVVTDNGEPAFFDFTRQVPFAGEIEDPIQGVLLQVQTGSFPTFATGEYPAVDYVYSPPTFDSASVYLKLTPSGVDEYTPGGGGTEYVDSNTVSLALTPSVVESRESTDAATVTLTLTPSATEQREVTDAATVGLTLTPSAVESREVTDAATVSLTLTPSATEVQETVDSATVTLTLTPSGVDEHVTDDITISRVQWKTADGDNPSITFDTTPVEGNLLIVSAMERNGLGTAGFSISGSGWIKQVGRDVLLSDTTARMSLTVWWKVAGPSEPTTITVTTTGTIAARILAEELEPSAATTFNYLEKVETDSGATDPTFLELPFTSTLVGGELCIPIYAVRVGNPSFLESNVALRDTIDQNLVQGHVAVNFARYLAHGFELAPSGAANSEWYLISGGLTDGIAGAMLVFGIGGVEHVDSDTVYLSLTPSAVELREITDADTVTLALTPSVIEERESADTETVYLSLTPSGTDEYQTALGTIQLVTSTVADPPTADQMHKGWLEEMGFTVVFIDDSAAADTTGAVGVVIAESVASGSIAAKYNTSDVPVVTHEALNADDLRLCSSALNPTSNFTQMQILEPTHEIADGPFGTFSGDVTVYSTGVRGGAWSGLAAGVVGIADRVGTTNEYNIIAAEAGATLTTGTAPARRVAIAGNQASIPFLTADGIALIKNAYAWAFDTTAGTTYTDSDTVVLTMTPSAVEVEEAVDEATVTLTLTPSSVEERESVDADTVYVALVPSAVETREITDAATVGLVLTPSGTDISDVLDSGTATVVLTPSSTDESAVVDAATVTLALTPSAEEEYTTPGGTLYTDAATVSLILTPSALEERTVTDAQTVTLTLTPSATEARDSTDTETVRLTLVPSAAENRETQDAATATVVLTPSSTEERVITDAATVSILLSPSSVDAYSITDAATAYVLLTPSSTDDHLTPGGYTDAATVTLLLTPSGVDEYEVGGTEYVDANTATIRLTPSGSEVAEFVEGVTVSVNLTPSSTDEAAYVEDTVATVRLTPSSVEYLTTTDEETVRLTLTPSGTTTLEVADASTVTLVLEPSSTDEFATVDTGTVYVTITPGVVAPVTFILKGRAYLRWDSRALGRRYSGRTYKALETVYGH